MKLSKHVSISGRFLRSIRIDKDTDISEFEGYILTKSLQDLLFGMAGQQKETQQGAYTWTGPYGSGKSSLALALSFLLSGSLKARKAYANIIGNDFATKFWDIMPPMKNGWKNLSIIGRRGEPYQIVAQALVDSGFALKKDVKTIDSVIEKLLSIAKSLSKTSGGLILVIDEMGKFLENAAFTDGDVYFFQLLAEAASRSNGRLIVIGILHQSFQEYSNRLARESRDEWAKIQGRFADISVNVSGEEQIELISRAIQQKSIPQDTKNIATKVASLIRTTRPGLSKSIAKTLTKSWPLNPVSTVLLGPLSRRSYGQNQRSIFSFLGSSEGLGFQDFLSKTNVGSKRTFLPENLWDYLLFNLEPSIAVSPDSHHFSSAKDALARVNSNSNNNIEDSIIKTIAILELNQQQTGLGAGIDVICCCLPHITKKEILKAIEDLELKSIIIFKKFREVYTLFEGSDFDIEDALKTAYRESSSVDLSSISNALAVSSISAKRHYHQTGTLRWCDIRVLPIEQIESMANDYSNDNGAFGLFVLAIPTNNESKVIISKKIKLAQLAAEDFDIVISKSENPNLLLSYAKDLTALHYIKKNNNEIRRDKIARREIYDRIDTVSSQVELEVWKLLNGAEWVINSRDKRVLSWTGINELISELADKRFSKTPKLFNELLNRSKPSGSASGALKKLLYAMISKEGEDNLGIQKFPAEKGLFVSLIKHNNLYTMNKSKRWEFIAPKKNNNSKIHALWDAARTLLKNKENSINLEDLYNVWRQAPFGIKDGVLPLLSTLFMITKRKNLAYYREGIFLSTLSFIDIDVLLKAPKQFQLRWMSMSKISRKLLGNMAELVNEISDKPVLNLEPLDVGRSLISAFESVAPWVHRTSRLSKNAKDIRALFKRSNDPNKFIFDDIPGLYANQTDITSVIGIEYISDQVKQGLKDILQAYELMLNGLRDQVLKELQVHSRSIQAYKELNDRAKNIKGISGNLRLEAFINRLCMLDSSLDQMESLAGLAINKPSKNWIDGDLDRAAIELINFAQEFNKHETIARVKGRKDKRESMAVIVGLNSLPKPYLHEFNILESDKQKVEKLVNEIINVLGGNISELDQNILLASLATVSARVINENESTKNPKVINHG
jgi:hypothetical protein